MIDGLSALGVGLRRSLSVSTPAASLIRPLIWSVFLLSAVFLFFTLATRARSPRLVLPRPRRHYFSAWLSRVADRP